MKTNFLIVLLSITNLAFSQTESQARKWGIYAGGGIGAYRWDEEYPIRIQVTIGGGKMISEHAFFGMEAGVLEYRERNTINFFYGSSGPNGYSAYFAGPKANLYLLSPVVISGSMGIGKAQRFVGDRYFDSGIYGTGSLSIGVDVLKKEGKGQYSFIPLIQYKADYFGVKEPDYHPEVPKFRNTIFLKFEIGYRFGTGKT